MYWGNRAIKTYSEAKKLDSSLIPLDANRNGHIDAGEGVVLIRCGERFLVEASDNYLEASIRDKNIFIYNDTPVPAAAIIQNSDTVASVKEKIRAVSGVGVISYVKPIRSYEVFKGAATHIADRLPEVVEARSFTALYVASGSHIAPLATFFELIDLGLIDQGKLVMTELDEHTADGVLYYCRMLQGSGVIEDCQSPDPVPKESPYEYSIEITYKSKKIELSVEIGMSGEDYYTPEDLQKANAVILHDVNAGIAGDNALLTKILQDQRKHNLNQVIMLENETDRFAGVEDGSNDLTFLNHTRLPGPYGHRGNGETEYSDYRSALLLGPQQPLLTGLSPDEIDLTIRFATLGTERNQYTRRLAGSNNDKQCYRTAEVNPAEPTITPFTEREIRYLIRIVMAWMELPQETLPPIRKDQILLHLLYYLYTEYLASLDRPDEWAVFYDGYRDLFPLLKTVFEKHIQGQLRSRQRRDMEIFMDGNPPQPDAHQTEISLNSAVRKIVRQFNTE